MYRNYDTNGRGRSYGRSRQQQQVNVEEAFAQLQQQAVAWQQEAQRLKNEVGQWETAVSQQNKQIEAERQQHAQQIAALAPTEETNEWESAYQRQAEEYAQSKKRLEQRYARQAEMEKEELLRQMLPVADNLERALAHVSNPEERAGIELTLKTFTAVLTQNNVQKINAQNQPFDPNLHQAVSTAQNSEHPVNTIIAVTENGYTINRNLLRPAQVIVATA